MYVLDTDCLSELRKINAHRAHPNVVRWASTVDINDLYLSVVTIFEIEMGCLRVRRRDPVQSKHLEVWIKTVLTNFAARIIDIDVEIARHAAILHVPDPRALRDSLIAATAAVRDFTVVTRNVADFARTNARIFNPWAD